MKPSWLAMRVGNRLNNAPAPNRRPRSALGSAEGLGYPSSAPPACPAAVGEANVRPVHPQMNLNIHCSVTALALLLGSASATAQGNLVTNGSFTGGANGWLITNTPGGFGYQSVGGNPGGCVALDNVTPSTSSDPTASQAIVGFMPGMKYAVSGQYLVGKDRGGGSPTDTSFGVAIDGVFGFEAVATTNRNWLSFAFLYTAASSNAVLSLSSQIHGTGVSYFIDNIVVQELPMLTASVVGTNIMLSWPTNVVGFALQSATNFWDWLNVTNAVVIAGSYRTVTLRPTQPNECFRLKR